MEGGVPISEIPREVIADAGKTVSDFAIGLVAVRRSESDEDAELGGSGTLVRIDDARGILTAYHVLEHLAEERAIGLIIVAREKPLLHRVILDWQTVHPLRVAYGHGSPEGPDLGLLLLSPVDAGWLGATKSFYNLPLHREDVLQNPPWHADSVWLLCGFAGELTKDLAPERGYARVKAFRGACGTGWVEKEYCRGEFDYFEFEAKYGGVDEPPQSFGGFSGAGLWQARVIRTPEGTWSAERPILSGVAFYQSPVADGRRLITCHGRRSVYVHVVEAVRRTAS